MTAEYDSLTQKEMPLESFSRLAIALPDLKKRIASYADFARSDVATVLGAGANGAVRVGATTFDHMLFVNQGGRFEARALPAAAQLAPASGPVVADFDGDGREDLFLSQNFYPTEIGTLRFDAGVGVLLLGDGAGNFQPQSVRQSGISVLGDQRGAATADFDGDGRADLAVAQNGTLTRLFRNVRARQGLRVKLDGGPENPLGIGAQMRVMARGQGGPVREVRAGTGYWSMDGAITVLARPANADSVWVRWPGGKEQRIPISSEKAEVIVRK
jgi:hypothetical protein